MRLIPFLLLLFILYSCSGPDRKPEKTGKEGTAIPSFELLLTDSITHVNVAAAPAGKPVVLFFFGPQCPYSHAEMEMIIKNESKLKDIQFYIFSSPPFQLMKAFSEYFKLNKYSNLTIGMDSENYFLKYFNTSGVPYTAIYGKDGKLKEAYLGQIDVKHITRAIEKK
ncbi:TlpA family protein disulfide reductase [Chitinophaga solisilvae]|uniref:TlpA family protein disulfide reductase n=1 Tax=Chitinophaga solisilvae TaxID=1233460 RepID=UPI00136D0EA1|nr:redoxin family protein [Chitinophaga solisilvae]